MKQKAGVAIPPSSPSPMNLPPKIQVEEMKKPPLRMAQEPDATMKSSELVILSDSSDDENPRRMIRSNPALLYTQHVQDSSESIISISSSDDEPLLRTGRRSIISDDDDDDDEEEEEEEEAMSNSTFDVESVASTSDDVEFLSGDKDSTFVLEDSTSESSSSEENDSVHSFNAKQGVTNEGAQSKSGITKNWRISENLTDSLPEPVPGFSSQPPRPSARNSVKPSPLRSTFHSKENVVDEIVDDFSPPKSRTIDTASENELRELARIKLPYFLSIQQLNAQGCRISKFVERL